MKKLMSVLLALLMLVSATVFAVPASAASEATPIVYIRGNGEKLYNANGEEILVDVGNLSLEGGEDSKNKIIEACVNIILPFLTEGLAFDKWDNYGKAIYNELSPLFKEAILDGNGNAQYGTGVSPEALAKSEARANQNVLTNGQYDYFTYMFCYDWRLDPYEHVDRLHEYIETVMRATKSDKISLTSRCLGGSLLNAYLEKYGSQGHIKNVLYCETLSDGCALISKGFSGQVVIDSKSFQRYTGQLGFCKEIGFGVGFGVSELAGEIASRTLDILTQTGVMNSVADGVEKLYEKLYKALMPALFHSFGYASQPIYWTMVENEDFDLALEVMFGKEGSESRTYFAGLIEKIQNYREKVTSKRNELYRKCSEDYKIHMGVIAKYGMLNAPFTVGHDDLSDALVSLKDSSLGATCAKIDSTLSESYIAERTEKGFGKYISPDKQVDASNCMFPDATWFIKNVHHDDFDRVCRAQANAFLNGTGVTVENSGYGRFRVNDYKTLTVTDMTAENCGDLSFISLAEKEPTRVSILVSLMNWITSVINFFIKLFKGELAA